MISLLVGMTTSNFTNNALGLTNNGTDVVEDMFDDIGDYVNPRSTKNVLGNADDYVNNKRIRGVLDDNFVYHVEWENNIIVRSATAKDKGFIDKIFELRNKLPSKFKRSGNFSYAEAEIDGVNLNYYASSSINTLDKPLSLKKFVPDISVQPTNIYYNAKKAMNDAGDIYLRDSCAEYKIINDIASKLKPGSSGKITIFTELEPCPSCKNIINQLKNDYPNIEIEVIHNNGQRIY